MLDLSWDSIGDKGALCLAAVIQNTRLHSVQLMGNPVSVIGALGILDATREMRMEFIGLAGTHIHSTVKGGVDPELLSSITQCRSLRSLDIRGNGIPLAKANLLSGAMMHNSTILGSVKLCTNCRIDPNALHRWKDADDVDLTAESGQHVGSLFL